MFVTHDQDEAFVLGDSVAVMSAGEIIQIGSPEQIYQAPSTRWVAEFVGDANFVTGTADGASVDTLLGRLGLEKNLAGSVEVLIRPEDLSIRPAEPREQGSSPTGTVTLVEYLGHGTRYLVDCDGVTLTIRRPSMPVMGRGETAVVEYMGTGTAVAFAAG